MAFMKIAKNGGKTKVVTKRTYDTLFKKKGYEVIEVDVVEGETTDNEFVEDVEEEEEIPNIPISQMNKEQLMKFAEANDIELDGKGLRGQKQVKEYVQKVMKERRM